jgi:hypothetical protein
MQPDRIPYRVTVDIDIFCTDFASYPTKFVQYIRACQKGTQRKCPEMAGYSYTVPPSTYSAGPWYGCGGCTLSTRKVLRSFDVRNIVTIFDRVFSLEIAASEGVSRLPCYVVRILEASCVVHVHLLITPAILI